MTPTSPSILADGKGHCPRGLHSATPHPGVDVPSFQKVPNAPHLETAFGLQLPSQRPRVGDGVKVCLGRHWRGKWHRNPELRNLVGKTAPVLHSSQTQLVSQEKGLLHRRRSQTGLFLVSGPQWACASLRLPGYQSSMSVSKASPLRSLCCLPLQFLPEKVYPCVTVFI